MCEATQLTWWRESPLHVSRPEHIKKETLMKTLFAIATVVTAFAIPASVQADGHGHGSHHGNHGHSQHHGGWNHNHHYHGHGYRPSYGNFGWRPVYRPYPAYYGVPYRTGFSVATPNVWIGSGW